MGIPYTVYSTRYSTHIVHLNPKKLSSNVRIDQTKSKIDPQTPLLYWSQLECSTAERVSPVNIGEVYILLARGHGHFV